MSQRPAPSLSLFSLQQAVGRGAMGEVWLARHDSSAARVAIKFLHLGQEQEADASAALFNEVRASAGLQHPNIVTVLDYGRVDLKGSLSANRRLAVGTPYLVMEFVPGRSLQSVVGRLRWERMREILVLLLDALAHSHARGVIHRDLKPGNVLLRQAPLDADGGRRPPDPLITDFGVAQAFTGGSQGKREVVGTPAYMAPEQLQGRWRDQGPWTDLYSVGCLAWSLATSTPPFGRGRTFEENRDAHLRQAPPDFAPLMALPDGVEGWLRRLLCKSPADRYACAADALVGLLALPSSMADPPAPVVPPPAPQLPPVNDPGAPTALTGDRSVGPDTLTLGTIHDQVSDQPLPPQVLGRDPGYRGMPPRVVARPVPTDWRQPRPPAIPPQLFGVGLNLYELREVPLVGRVPERERLWRALRAVDRERRPRAVLLQGPSGCGKSRLMSWLAERAQEIGAATVLEAPTAGEGEGGGELEEMFSRYFRTEGMRPEHRTRRLTRLLSEHGHRDPDEVRALMELVGVGDAAQTAPRALAGRGERARLQGTLLRAIVNGPRGAPLLMVALDNAQWSPDALELTRSLLDRGEADLPVLVVMTAQTDALPEQATLRALFEQVRDHQRTEVLAVDRLSDAETTELVQLLLGIESGLVAKVVRRCAGNPHYAVEIVRDWVRAGKLELGKRGFELRKGVLDEMPPDLQHSWREQVERQLARLEPSEVRALELAAALGNQVDSEEWHAVCALTQMNPSPRLLADMLDARIVQLSPEQQGWSFTNPMFREVLEVRSRQGGRYRRIHLACARVLEPRSGKVLGIAERLARHLLRAGQGVPATGPLLQAASERLQRGQSLEAERIVDVTEKVFSRLRMPTEDPLWGQCWMHKARMYRLMGDPARARRWAARAEEASARHGWSEIERQARDELAILERDAATDGAPA